MPSAGVGVGDVVGEGRGAGGVLRQTGDDGFFQGLSPDVLRVPASAAGVVVALVVMRLGEDQRGPTGGTAHDARGPALQLEGGAGLVAPLSLHRVQLTLSRLPGLDADQGLMAAIGHDDVLVEEVSPGPPLWIPAELPDVDRIAKDVLHGPVLEGIAPVSADAHGIEFPGDDIDALAGQEAVEDAADVNSFFLIGDQYAVLDAVAKGGGGLEPPALRVDFHAALDLLAQPDGVKFVHPLNDALDEGAEGTGDQRLGDAHHVDVALGTQDGFVEDAFLLVPGEARVFPEKDDGEGAVWRFGGSNHPHELRPTLRFLAGDAGVNVNLVIE